MFCKVCECRIKKNDTCKSAIKKKMCQQCHIDFIDYKNVKGDAKKFKRLKEENILIDFILGSQFNKDGLKILGSQFNKDGLKISEKEYRRKKMIEFKKRFIRLRELIKEEESKKENNEKELGENIGDFDL